MCHVNAKSILVLFTILGFLLNASNILYFIYLEYLHFIFHLPQIFYS